MSTMHFTHWAAPRLQGLQGCIGSLATLSCTEKRAQICNEDVTLYQLHLCIKLKDVDLQRSLLTKGSNDGKLGQVWVFNGWIVVIEASNFSATSFAVPGKSFGRTGRGNLKAGFWHEMRHTFILSVFPTVLEGHWQIRFFTLKIPLKEVKFRVQIMQHFELQ